MLEKYRADVHLAAPLQRGAGPMIRRKEGPAFSPVLVEWRPGSFQRLMRNLLFFLLCLGIRAAHAQIFGGIRPSTHWRQIDTDTVRVIFRRGMAADARQVANTATYLNRHARASIGNKELKINIVLQNRTTEPNGFVALAPFRSILQITPPADNFSLGSENWVQMLTLHEYRHALQNMNFRSGIGKTFYEVFGENGQSFITNLLIPDWFWEGDAVFMETALSAQGRGRLPSFLEPFKSLSYAGIHYRYAKIRNGSLRDRVPDQYPLGYMMTAYGRTTGGIDFWKKATQEALLNHKFIRKVDSADPRRPYRHFRYGFYPLSSALRYMTGSKIRGFYEKSLGYFSAAWESARKGLQVTQVDTIRRNMTRSWLSYRYPQILPGGGILAIRYGYGSPTTIVRIDSAGREHRVVRIGDTRDDYYSYANGRIVWSERRPNARWGWTDYSVVRIYDMRTRHASTLSRRSRYFSPSLSPDGKRIVVADVSDRESCRLLVLDAETGRILDTLPNPRHLFYTYPVFSPDGASVVAAVRDTAGRMALMRQPVAGGSGVLLTSFYRHPLGPPEVTGRYVFFPAAFTDNVQLYALDKRKGTVFRVAVRPLGDYSIAADSVHHRLVFDEYTARGYQLDSLPLDPSSWTPVNTGRLQAVRYPYVPQALKAEGGNISGQIPRVPYPVSRYSQVRHLIYPHGLYLMAAYPNIGLFTQSQDILNTLHLSAGGAYNFNEKTPSVSFNALYGGWFPVLQFGYQRTFNRNAYTSDGSVVTWNESGMYGGGYIPLDLSSNLYQRSLTVGAILHYNGLDYRPSPVLKHRRQRMTYLDESLSLSNARLMTLQQIYPKFGQTMSLDFEQGISSLYARQFSAAFNFFFPGLFRHHSLYFTLAFSQNDDRNEYKFADNFNYVSGYSSVPYRKIYKAGINYQLPLAYPDAGLTWAYLLRVRLHLFFNYSHADMLSGIRPSSGTFRSVGGAVYLDTRLFSYLQVPVGVRYSYLLDHDFNRGGGRRGIVELVIPATLFNGPQDARRR